VEGVSILWADFETLAQRSMLGISGKGGEAAAAAAMAAGGEGLLEGGRIQQAWGEDSRSSGVSGRGGGIGGGGEGASDGFGGGGGGGGFGDYTGPIEEVVSIFDVGRNTARIDLADIQVIIINVFKCLCSFIIPFCFSFCFRSDDAQQDKGSPSPPRSRSFLFHPFCSLPTILCT
jgi:hypothetical protein